MSIELRLANDHEAAEVPVVVLGSLKSAARGARWRPHQDAFCLHSVHNAIYSEADKSTTFRLADVVNASNWVCVLQRLYHLILLRVSPR